MKRRVSIIPGIGPVDIDRAQFVYRDGLGFVRKPRMYVSCDGLKGYVDGELADHIRDGLEAAKTARGGQVHAPMPG